MYNVQDSAFDLLTHFLTKNPLWMPKHHKFAYQLHGNKTRRKKTTTRRRNITITIIRRRRFISIGSIANLDKNY